MDQYDLIIVGGGAAGLSAAQYGARANLKTVLIESKGSGGQAILIDTLENYPGFPEPINGIDFAMRMEQQARNFGAHFKNGVVTSLTCRENRFYIDTAKESFVSPAVIMATGAEHRRLGIPGEERFSGKGVSYCATCDGPFFRGKKILVVGGGDAACDEAIYLANLSEKIVLVHRRDRFRAQKALAERTLNHPNIEVRFNTVVTEVKGEEKVSSLVLAATDSDKSYEEPFDALFVFVGSIPQTGLVETLEKDEAGYLITDQEMRTSLPGLYAVGDIRTTPFRQIVTAASDGAIAAHSASQYIDELKGNAYR